jgi:hypothetical protein
MHRQPPGRGKAASERLFLNARSTARLPKHQKAGAFSEKVLPVEPESSRASGESLAATGALSVNLRLVRLSVLLHKTVNFH